MRQRSVPARLLLYDLDPAPSNHFKLDQWWVRMSEARILAWPISSSACDELMPAVIAWPRCSSSGDGSGAAAP